MNGLEKIGGSCRYLNQWGDSSIGCGLYARGEQSVAKYKNEIAVDGDLSYLNLDWTPVPIIPKMVDIVVNGLNDRLFKVEAFAEDAMSAEKRNQFQDKIEGQMIARPLLEQITNDFELDVFQMDPKQLPENDQELELFMQMNYKPAVEIAAEEAISTVLHQINTTR